MYIYSFFLIFKKECKKAITIIGKYFLATIRQQSQLATVKRSKQKTAELVYKRCS